MLNALNGFDVTISLLGLMLKKSVFLTTQK